MATQSSSPPARAFYRARQFWHALNPRVAPADLARARDLLGEPLAPLFFAMEKRDQRHAIEVMRRLTDTGATDPDLLTAALLHDCAKGRVPVWLRVLRVLSPRLLALVAAPEPSTGWRAAAYRLQHDASLSARRVAAAGGPPAAVRLIEGRVSPSDEPRLAQLRAADDAS